MYNIAADLFGNKMSDKRETTRYNTNPDEIPYLTTRIAGRIPANAIAAILAVGITNDKYRIRTDSAANAEVYAICLVFILSAPDTGDQVAAQAFT